jgi:hypothetical protein
MRSTIVAPIFLAILLAAAPARAEDAPGGAITCPFPGQKPMLIVRLFFGRLMPDHRTVSPQAWRTFVTQDAIPRLPDGFTVYDTHGFWTTGQEASTVIETALADSPQARETITALATAYRTRFKQQSVGIVSTQGCGAF